MINRKGDQYIALSSITYAQKAKDILNNHGVKTYIIRTPKEFTSCGCGFSLRLNRDNSYRSAEELAELLKKYDIKIVGIYP